jgi:hypothetical protein
VDTIGTQEDRYGVQHLAIGCRQQPKKHTQGSGGSQQKMATVREQLTHCAVPALHKGHSHREPGNGIRGRSRRQELRLGSKATFYDALGQIIRLEFVMLTIRSSVRIRKMSAKTMWRSRLLPKRKKRLHTA